MTTGIVSSSTSSVPAASKKRSRVVSFDTVEIRAYPMILDESRYQNCYVTLGWDSLETTVITIDDMECSKQGGQRIQPLSVKGRLFILLRAGYSATQLREHISKPDPDANSTMDDDDDDEDEEQLHYHEEKDQQPMNQGHQNVVSTMQFCNILPSLEAPAKAA